MDKSEKNTKMCSKAHEIQDKWKFEPGDYFTTPSMSIANDDPCIVDDFWLNDELTKRTLSDRMKLRAWVWLPRQDQLQDMLGEYISSVGILIKYIDDPDFDSRYFSWEQAWLCVVMREKYDKKWDGGEWIIW